MGEIFKYYIMAANKLDETIKIFLIVLSKYYFSTFFGSFLLRH